MTMKYQQTIIACLVALLLVFLAVSTCQKRNAQAESLYNVDSSAEKVKVVKNAESMYVSHAPEKTLVKVAAPKPQSK
jgi:YbbR domain-containing protein